jgi:hypothetical protein
MKTTGLLASATTALLALAASTAANAQTIFLKCGAMDVITVDLAKSTVNNKPANITPVAIDWENENDSLGIVHIHIDRSSGTLSTTGTYHLPSGDTPIPRTTDDACTVSNQPSTKF